MEQNQNFFENWMTSQKSMMDNWIEMGKTIQENVKNQTNANFSSARTENPIQDWTNRSNEMMQNWQKMMNSWKETSENQTTEKMNDFTTNFSSWMENQKKSIDSWSSQIQNIMNQSTQNLNNSFSNGMNNPFMNNMNPMNNMFNASNMNNNWMNMASMWQKNFMDNIQSNSNQMMNNFQNMGFNWSNDTAKNVFENASKNSEIYNSMMKTWNDFSKNSMNGNVDSWKQYFTPTYFKSMMDKMFGFDVMETQKSMFMNFNKMSEMMAPMMSSWKTMQEGMMPNMGNNQNNPMIHWASESMKQMNMMTAPFFKVMAPGKEKSIMENGNSMVEKFAEFMEKTTQLQNHYYKTGYAALESVMNDYKDMQAQGKSFDTFQEFFNHWNKVTENAFVNLFNTDDYSTLQGDLMTLDLDLKNLGNQQMEIMLEPFPVVLKKEMDEVYMNSYELRKRVRSMEKELELLKSNMNYTSQNNTVHNNNQSQDDSNNITNPNMNSETELASSMNSNEAIGDKKSSTKGTTKKS